ncbi:MAG: UvrD-helicase domain-containing protein [Oscillospiraceae bacterium]|jgi:ATP-dependent helicase/nuclease subunit A|nr:UvrD-helicase domain-containing protein [Oscillospiraceae bacterium]
MRRIGLTREQDNAVYARASAVLVSAAAGSGKTRVLTERLMSYVTDGDAPQDVTAFLIITYTRAAAGELRARILDELSLRAAAEPEDRRLRRQAALCYQAQIGTIHSFCTAVLREHAHRAGLDPDFRVGDENICAELRERALEKTLERAYGQLGGDEDFARLVESVGAGRDDSRLARALLELYAKMQSHPYPESWAARQAAALDVSCLGDAGETVWGRELLASAGKSARYWLERLETLWRSLCTAGAENALMLAAYGESIGETMDALRRFISALGRGWDAAGLALPIPFPRLKQLRSFAFEDRKNAFTAAREGCKNAMESLSAVFSDGSERLLAELAETAPAMRALLRLALDFGRAYSAEKRRRGLLDFSDLEHCAVRLLCDAETGLPTETARDISRRYTEIMVDEYQDVNAVQDLIFRCISREGGNIFMVGDVKQSIYRFRLADPTIFLEKYRDFSDFISYEDNNPRRILLQNNFRSDRNILTACNHIFSNIMSEALGDIAYDEKAALFPPEDAPSARGKAELRILAVPQAEDGEERPDKTYLEAKQVVSQIRALVSGGELISENGALRPVRYGDIAILLRSPNAAGAQFRRALAEAGVPVLAEQGGAFFSSPEILITLSLLSVIDNPHRDVPLAAVLSSPVFDFSADELSMIRAGAKEGDFFSAVEKAARENNKCAAFIDTLSGLRALSEDIGVCELLCLIYDRLDLSAVCNAVYGGCVNLTLLLDCAARFEENGYRGLFAFIRQLRRMEASGEEPAAGGAQAGSSVVLMSIHKSKGLEFPVVFLANTARAFNRTELRAAVLIHPELGLGCKLTDTARGIEYPTLARRAIAARLNAEMLSEEMRVLYVALTRAKERLYISCTDKDPEALLAKLSAGLSQPLSPEILSAQPAMAHWLISAALLDGGGPLKPMIVYAEDLSDAAAGAVPHTPAAQKAAPVDENALAALREQLSFRYPYERAVRLPSKITATALPREEPEEAGEALVKAQPRSFRLPDFMAGERPLTGAERGTATHIVMQLIDFSKTATHDQLAGEIERLRRTGQLDDKQARAVDRNAILTFFASETGKTLKAAEKVHRERRFSILCPASVFFPDGGSEDILLQGIVDCCIERESAIEILDYKTDYVTPETLDERTEHYKKQLLAYAHAMSRMFGKRVSSCKLCFLCAGLVSAVPPPS